MIGAARSGSALGAPDGADRLSTGIAMLICERLQAGAWFAPFAIEVGGSLAACCCAERA